MMGHQSRSEALFYYFRLEDQVPENHLLRLIDRHVSLEFIRAKLKGCYSDTGRPSIDPELLLRMLLIGYLYGVTSERKLVEELRMHLAWRWFTGLGFDQEIPHHSTFSKNRHGRFQESNLFQEIFEEIVARCVEAGLVKGEHMSVDGSFIQANADHHSRVPPEQLAEVAKVNHTVREYLVELERENPVELPVAQQEKVSTTDPDSTYATKGGPARLGYYDNYLVDNGSCIIVGVQATPARLSQESVAARDMIERYRARYGQLPQTLAADTTYGNGEMLQWLDERGIAAYIRVKENPNGIRSVAAAVAEFLDETKLTKKPKTLAAYSTALAYFVESCHKLNLEEIDRKDLLKFSAFLRDEKDQAPRSVYNKFENVMTFLKAPVPIEGKLPKPAPAGRTHPPPTKVARASSPTVPPVVSPATSPAASPATSPATLEIEVEHNFAAAHLSIWVDDRLTYTHQLEGTDKKHLVVFHHVQGHEFHAMQVSPGKHSLRVQVTTDGANYDQSATVEGEFASGQENVLRINFDKHREMNLSLQ